MSKRNDRAQVRAFYQAQELRRQVEQATAATTCPQERARITAGYQRQLYGHVPICDDQPHYLCELGLRPVDRGRQVSSGEVHR